MKILIEGHAYAPALLEGVLPESRLLMTGDAVPIEYVGYYRSPACKDFVFFLPKVLLESVDGKVDASGNKLEGDRVFCRWENPRTKEKLLSGFRPEDIIDVPSLGDRSESSNLTPQQTEFLYGFSVWIYQALERYLVEHRDTKAVWHQSEPQSGGFKRRDITHTLLDVILSMRRFNRDNQDYFRFKVKENHAGYNKINWTKTVAHSQAFIQDGTPVYLNPCNKKKVIDFDEELLVIFYSILEYVRTHFSIKIDFNLGYELITGKRFERYLNGYGERRLRQIKYKYFSDRDIMMWKLCFAFFSKMRKADVSRDHEEYLLAKDFEIVFESIIDTLIGDRELDKLKELDDGKEIDHLYLDDSLTRHDGRQTFYIADSKYYKIDRKLEQKSVAKQFTYARDMLQLNLDLFLPATEEEISENVKRWRKPFAGKNVSLLRDRETEGYDIIPNFFISARMDEDLSYEDPGLHRRRLGRGEDEQGEHHSIHFEGRLFDRDTLILSHYNVNFLYVLKLYAQNSSGAQLTWKTEVHNTFKREILKLLHDRYIFKAIMPHEGVNAKVFFEENFSTTQGRIYSPYVHEDGKPDIYLMALENPHDMFEDYQLLSTEGISARAGRIEETNRSVETLIDEFFYKTDPLDSLSVQPRQELEKLAHDHPIVHAPPSDSETGVQVVAHVKGPLTKAIEAVLWCPCPAEQCTNPDAIRTIVIPHTQDAHLYRVVQGVEIKRNLDDDGIRAAFGEAFDGIAFPSLPCHFWKVERIA